MALGHKFHSDVVFPKAKARAVARTLKIEFYLALALLLVMSVFASHAKAASFESFNMPNIQLELSQPDSLAFDKSPAGTNAGTNHKDYMLGTSHSLIEENRFTLSMKGGFGVAATQNISYSGSDNTSISPAFKVGLGALIRF